MAKILMRWLGLNKPGNDEFSEFFRKSSKDKTKVIRQVIREANQDQKNLVQRYNSKYSKFAS